MKLNNMEISSLTRKQIITAATNKGYLWKTRTQSDTDIDIFSDASSAENDDDNKVKFCRSLVAPEQTIRDIVQWLESRGFKVRSTGTTERTAYAITTCGIYVDEYGHCHNTLTINPRKCSTCRSFIAGDTVVNNRCSLLLIECWPNECCECWE